MPTRICKTNILIYLLLLLVSTLLNILEKKYHINILKLIHFTIFMYCTQNAITDTHQLHTRIKVQLNNNIKNKNRLAFEIN